MCLYPSIDLKATGRNIARLRKERGLSVKQLQAYFGFEDPQAVRSAHERDPGLVKAKTGYDCVRAAGPGLLLRPFPGPSFDSLPRDTGCLTSWTVLRCLYHTPLPAHLSLNRWFNDGLRKEPRT